MSVLFKKSAKLEATFRIRSIHYYRRRLHSLLAKLFPMWVHERETRNWWETRWSQENFPPFRKPSLIPKELRDAVDSGWFQPGAAVLDIGCGSGEFAAWLASRGFRVLGIDCSSAAIDRARSQHGEISGSLEFKALDICRELPGPAKFNAVFDRGCYQVVLERFRSDYARNVASCSAPGARFLLIVAVGAKSEAVIRNVKTIFQPLFDISKMEKTHLDMASGVDPKPGMAFWLSRRED